MSLPIYAEHLTSSSSIDNGLIHILDQQVPALDEGARGPLALDEEARGPLASDEEARGPLALDEEARGPLASDEEARGPLASDEEARGQNITTLPPYSVYASKAALEEALHSYTKREGFDMTKGRNMRKNKSGEIYAWELGCHQRGDGPKNSRKLRDEDRVRPKRGSAGIKCRASFWMSADKPDNLNGSWSLRSKRNPQGHHHNHGPLPPITFPSHQRRAQKEASFQTSASSAHSLGTTSGKTVAYFQQTDQLVVYKDIANLRSTQRQNCHVGPLDQRT